MLDHWLGRPRQGQGQLSNRQLKQCILRIFFILFWCLSVAAKHFNPFKRSLHHADMNQKTCVTWNLPHSLNNTSPPPTFPTPEPQATAGADRHSFFERDYLHGAWQGGSACSAPTDCDTYLTQAPVCLPCLIRAQCAGLGHSDPSPALIVQPHIPWQD